MYEIPPIITEYGNFLRTARDVAADAARDDIIGWLVAIAVAGGACHALRIAWAFYTLVSTAIALHVLGSAASRLSALLP